MHSRFDLLTQQLFQKNISDCTVEELQRLTDQYPYFAPAQYALLKKLQQIESPDYGAQFQKTILYYHNPPLFEQFINEQSFAFDFAEPETAEEIVPVSDDAKEEEPAKEEAFNEPPTEEAGEFVSEELVEAPTAKSEAKQVDITKPAKEEVMEPAKEEAPLKVSLPALDEPANDSGTGLAFEPYHTVDYFASQGIKLSQEEATKDRFGRQLKSFTEWLKTMKKVPASEQLKPIDVASEKKVENLAAHSVDQAEIVTEAMAEVWLKQGNNEKAIEIYNKLSLLNPSKRAYFAAKVDSLKKEI